jgi:MFS family permease
MKSTEIDTNADEYATTVSVGKRRYFVAIGLLLVVALGYMDRINMSVAAPHIMEEFNLSTGQFGLITSVFNWAYIVVLIPAGMMADRLGPRLILPISIVVWSLGAGLTGAAAGLTALILARLLLGAGESSIYPVGNLVVRDWAPRKERGVFTGMLNAGALVGPALGAVIAGYLVVAHGWRESFFILGGAGVVFGALWFVLFGAPEKAKWLSDRERQMILMQRGNSSEEQMATPRMNLGLLLRTRTIWGLMITQGCAVYTSYLFLSFLPLYLVTERGLKDLGSGWVTGLTYAIAAVGSIAVAYVSDKVLKTSEVRSGGRRKLVVATLLMGLPLLALPWVNDIAAIIILISWVLIMITSTITLNFALASDLTTDKASGGRVFALVTFGGNFFGLLAPIVTGYLVDLTSSYTPPFLVAGTLLLIGAASSWILSRKALQPADFIAGNRYV